jgi:hypothetical protein
MPTYIVESYAAKAAVVDQRDRAARAAQAGSGITYIRTTVVPADQTLLHVFEATSSDALGRAVAIVALGCDRIVEVVESEGAAEMRARRSKARVPKARRERGSER